MRAERYAVYDLEAVPEAGLRPSESCYGVPDDYPLWLQIGRGDVSILPCESGAPFDPGTSGGRRGTYWGTEGGMIQPGEQVTARIWVAEPLPQTGLPPPVDVPGVRLGLALYADVAPGIYRITSGRGAGPKTILGFATYERVD